MFGRIVRRGFSTMATQVTTAPYTKAVVAAMRRLYPEELADKSFDNTGCMSSKVLLEAPFDPSRRRQKNSVLLTIDLTKAVADEAIKRRDSCIIAYHPIIFRGLKSLTLHDTQQQSLLRLAAEGISVYSPHTAVDAAPGGLGDWLADIVTAEPAATRSHNSARSDTRNDATSSTAGSAESPFTLQHHPSQLSLQEKDIRLGAVKHTRAPIRTVNVNGIDGAGMGRVVRLDEAVPLTTIVKRIGLGLGEPRGIQVAIPQGKQASDMKIKSIAICAGSGGSLFSELEKSGERADLLFTGELSHHEALAAIEKGQCVICLFHSNSERGFLHSVLKAQLEKAIPEEFENVRNELQSNPGLVGQLDEALKDRDFGVHVSEVDRDPYGIMVRMQGSS